MSGTSSALSARPLAWSLLPGDWRAVCGEEGWPLFRARQIWEWLHVRRAAAWPEMSSLPVGLRERLAARFDLWPWLSTEERRSADGVVKLLLAARDGETAEAVLIPSGGRLTLCVSTQSGCAFGCVFCATGRGGPGRDLDAGEIVGQLAAAAARAAPRRITHVVFMGMGEPFANYEGTLRAVRIINDADGIGIGARRITISTCGVVPGIRRLAGEGLQVELSVSLHAPDDALRARLMPVSRRWPLAEVLEACADYTAATGRIVTFEYTLIEGLNDSPAQAEALAARLAACKCRVNLIPLSPVEGFAGRAPEAAVGEVFAGRLRRRGINVTLRRSRGGDVDAACGQLRRRRAAGGPQAAGGARQSGI